MTLNEWRTWRNKEIKKLYLDGKSVIFCAKRMAISDDLARKIIQSIPQDALAKRLEGKRWHKRWDACRKCGETLWPHKNQGFCTRCYKLFKDAPKEEKIRNPLKKKKTDREYQKRHYVKRKYKPEYNVKFRKYKTEWEKKKRMCG